jgi:3-oxoacyl-ACP reductase-like protein
VELKSQEKEKAPQQQQQQTSQPSSGAAVATKTIPTAAAATAAVSSTPKEPNLHMKALQLQQPLLQLRHMNLQVIAKMRKRLVCILFFIGAVGVVNMHWSSSIGLVETPQ